MARVGFLAVLVVGVWFVDLEEAGERRRARENAGSAAAAAIEGPEPKPDRGGLRWIEEGRNGTGARVYRVHSRDGHTVETTARAAVKAAIGSAT